MRHRAPLSFALLIAALFAASPAGAHVVAQSDLRGPVPLGATDRLGSVTVHNEDPMPEDPSDPGPPPFVVCNLGECGSSQGITLEPSCAAQAPDEDCTAVDPGVFAISPTATGATSGCPGTQFTVTEISPGRFSFNPATPGEHIVLAPQFRCRIEFTYDVLHPPATDSMPALDGLQTTQVSEVFSAEDLGTAAPAFDRGSDSVTFFDPAPPTLGPAAPARPPARANAPDVTDPVLSALSLSRKRFRAPAGTRVRYRLSENAAVSFRVERIRAGRRVGGRCVTPRRANRGARRCRRLAMLRGALRDQGRAGANALRFRGRLRGRRLAPGLYRLSAVATDAAGNVSGSALARFRILRRRP